MQTGIKVILAVFSTFTFNAFADAGVSCSEVYEQASLEYVSEVGRLEQAAWEAGVISASSAGLAVGCVITGPALVPCLAAMGGISLVSYAYRWEGIRYLRKLESLNKLNIVYKNIKSGTAKESREVQEFVDLLGVDEQDAQEALGKLAWLMESGQLCRRGKASVKFEAAVKQLKPRLSWF